MYTPLQLNIIRLFGRKELTEGIIIKYDDEYFKLMTEIEWWIAVDSIQYYRNLALYFGEDEFEILWHIPHLEDVFRVAEEKWLSYTLFGGRIINHIVFHIDDDNDVKITIAPTLPLLEQSEDTLTQLCNLFK